VLTVTETKLKCTELRTHADDSPLSPAILNPFSVLKQLITTSEIRSVEALAPLNLIKFLDMIIHTFRVFIELIKKRGLFYAALSIECVSRALMIHLELTFLPEKKTFFLRLKEYTLLNVL
jgi:hypothetical protein